MIQLYDVYIFLIYLSFSFFISLGGFTLSLNPKDHINQIFTILCVALSIWVAAVLLSSISPNYEQALIWRRISSLGWGTLFSLIVHFVLLITGQKKLLKNPWVYVLLYLPSLINIFIFCFLSNIAIHQYELIYTKWGWINILEPNLWDVFFNSYYISYSLVATFFLIRWGFWGSIKRKEIAGSIIMSYLGAVILGSISERYLDVFTNLQFPVIVPFFITIPLCIIFYWIKKSNFMNILIEPENHKAGIILNRTEEIKVYKFLSLIFFFFSLNSLLRYFLLENIGIKEMQFALTSAIIGTVIYYLPSIVKNSFHRNNIMIVTMNTSVVLIMVHLSIINSDMTTWPFPFLIMLVSIVFNKNYLLISLAVSSIIANVLIWSMEEIPFDINLITEYSNRFLFFIFTTMLAFSINKIYLKRLKDHEDQILFQKMISSISSEIVTMSGENLKKILTSIIKKLGIYYHADHVTFVTFPSNPNIETNYFEWCLHNEICEEEDLADYLWIIDNLLKDEIVYFDSLDKLPSEAEGLKNKLNIKSIKSFIATPVSLNDQLLGLLVLRFKEKNIPKLEIKESIKIPSNQLANVMIKLENEKKINHLAYFDVLTELPNRILFYNRLENAVALARRENKIVAVMMMDLDSFKNVNDSMGHDAGDLLLGYVAKRLSVRMREYDTMSRFGGDEFMFIFSQIHERAEVSLISEKLLEAFDEPFIIANEEFYVTVSIGITLYPIDTVKPELLIKNSDLAMYYSKKQGKNCYNFYCKEMLENTHEKMLLASDLYKALDRGEFVVYYQPQVQIDSKKIIGVEALIRWNHPEKGLVNPSVFIPLAEETGLISAIGKWVLYTACRDNKSLQDKGLSPINLAVNLSVKQFYNVNLVDMVMEVLEETQLAPKYLELEITESIAISDNVSILAPLNELRELGVLISIDDFGTEYSSLSRLKQMPIDRIKIDKQFVDGISLNNNDESIISFIVELSKNMGVKVIAEGVEKDIQVSFLSDILCDEIQGFYFYKPMCFSDLVNVLATYQKS